MEFYLLGDGEREESTGYLYLEFKKADTEEYLTVGVGMRAQKGKGIDFWGFCLCDGRRIGTGGVSLYEKIGGQMLPLSKQKLRNLIGDESNWQKPPARTNSWSTTGCFSSVISANMNSSSSCSSSAHPQAFLGVLPPL